MFAKVFILALLLVGGNCRYIFSGYQTLDGQDLYIEETGHRTRRQIQGSATLNSDKTGDASIKIPLADNGRNYLSAVGSLDGAKLDGSYKAVGGGLTLENVNRHALSLQAKHIPDFGNQLTAAGKVNLLHSGKHDVSATAFATRNMPTIPNVPDFNSYGGKLGYNYNDKIGANVGIAKIPMIDRTDYSAGGNLNLFRGKDSSLDFNAGFSKTVMPRFDSGWQPSTGFSFTKWF